MSFELHRAVKDNNRELAEFLIKNGADAFKNLNLFWKNQLRIITIPLKKLFGSKLLS